MKHIPPYTIRDGRTLNPREVHAAFEYAARERDDINAQKWGYEEIVVPFGDLQTSDDAEEGRMYFTVPAALTGGLEVVGLELAVEAATAGTEYTLRIVRVSDSEVLATVSITPLTADPELASGPAQCTLAAGSEYYLEIPKASAWGTVALDRAQATVHYRFDQLEGQPATTFSGVAWGSCTNGDTVAAAWTAFDADVASRVAKVRRVGCTVASWRNQANPVPAAAQNQYLAANGRKCLAVSWGVIGQASKTWDMSILNAAASGVTATVEGLGTSSTARSQTTTFTETQTNDPDDPSDDFLVSVVENSTTNPGVRLYAFVWWEY